MSVFSAGTRGHYTNPYLIQATPKILAKFLSPKKSRNRKFQNLRSSPSLETGVAANPPALYCTVLCCAVILLVSIEDMCIAHVQTNIFIIESVCDR